MAAVVKILIVLIALFPLTTLSATIYAYSSEVLQTDGDPFTTADGSTVRRGIIANNCLPFGAEVAIYDSTLPNGVEVWRVHEVHDRMNSRYGCSTYDIWFPTKEEALQWGKKELDVLLLK